MTDRDKFTLWLIIAALGWLVSLIYLLRLLSGERRKRMELEDENDHLQSRLDRLRPARPFEKEATTVWALPNEVVDRHRREPENPNPWQIKRDGIK